MDLTLEKLSKQELIALIKKEQKAVSDSLRLQQKTEQLQDKVIYLEAQVAQQQRRRPLRHRGHGGQRHRPVGDGHLDGQVEPVVVDAAQRVV